MGVPTHPLPGQSQDLPIRTVKPQSGESFTAAVQEQSTAKEPGPAGGGPERQDNGAGGNEQDKTKTVSLVRSEPAQKKKKKRSKKPKSQRGWNKPTGFEEYYVDAPITPEQFREERELYDVSRPIIHRIEDAILRYQKNRRLESDRREIFTKYLSYGGVDVGPKMFGGIEGRELQQLDSEQILVTRGQASIAQERTDLEINFDAVVKGYLTSYFPYYFNPHSEEMVKLATVTIHNFLSYLLYHDVCPEYTANIDEARRSCDFITKELWRNQQYTVKAPGDFNTASSTLFGGYFYDIYVEDDKWAKDKDGYDDVRMTCEIARKVVKFALAGAGTDVQARRFQELVNEDGLRAMRVEDIDGFEITAVVPPDEDTRKFYAEHAPDLHPVGRLMGKAYRDPGKPSLDLSPEEQKAWAVDGFLEQEFEFFLEDDLLALSYPGMKVVTSVWELNCGMHFFDEVFTAYSSVYTVLVNDLMFGWKKPQEVGVGNDEGNEEDCADGENEAVSKGKAGEK